MKGWQRIAIVLSIVEFVGVGALLWIQFIGGTTDFYSGQLRTCVTQLEKADQSAPEPPAGPQKNRLQTENLEMYLTCQAQARTSLKTLTESQKQTMWMIAAIDAAMLAAGWLLAFGVVALARLVIRRLGDA